MMFSNNGKCGSSWGSLLLSLAITASPLAALGADSAEIVAVPSKPYPGAVSSLILDVEDTGEGLVAVGERGHILLSSDGKSWTQVLAPSDSLLTAVSFADARNGWAVGHDAIILHTQDGGQSWAIQHFEPQGAGPLLDVQFESPAHGFAVGAFGTFLETTDGGQSWEPADAPVVSEAGSHLYSISHFATGRWLIVGEMGFIATSEDGKDWTAVESPYHGSFYASAQLGEQGAVLVGMRGNAFSTADLLAGPWTHHKTDTVLSLTSVTRVRPREFVITTLNRQLLALNAAGPVTPMRLPEQSAESANTGSFNDALVLGDDILVASDQGVLHAPFSMTQASLSAVH